MRCEYCGTEFSGKFCHNCGNAAPQSTPDGEKFSEYTPLDSPKTNNFPIQNVTPGNSPQSTPSYSNQFIPPVPNTNTTWNTPDTVYPEKIPKKRSIVIPLFILFIVVMLIGVVSLIIFFGFKLQSPYRAALTQYQTDEYDNGNDPDFETYYSLENSEKSNSLQAETTGQYEIQLENGNYVAGIDFPAGTYDITAVSGYGYVYSSNSDGISELMGQDSEDDSYLQNYQAAHFPEGSILQIDGVAIYMVSADASVAALLPRENPAAQIIDLSPGLYTAGIDFPVGIYNVVAVNGQGFVETPNLYEDGIHTYIGIPSDYFYLGEYKNVALVEGIELEIIDVTVQLVPST